ncbi:hypothetical protein [Pseudomonas tohonis]|uniref:hypothetical protein n=1 Tax=Pseudomonas tohonis TaxID=2725477 RepID=UPI001F3B5149|nr:hypothetical protein [Pseudomonas tohonis]
MLFLFGGTVVRFWSFVCQRGAGRNEGGAEFKRDATQSFYVPGDGTSNIVYAANHIPLVFWGEPFEADIIVASDIGTNISRYSKEGALVWRVVTYPRTVRAIDIQGGYVVAFAQNDKLTIDIASGLVRKEESGQELYLFNKKIKGTQLVGLNDAGVGTIYINGKKLPYQTQWARDAIINRGKLYVSDTFGHRVMIFNLKKLKLLGQKNFYYPNDLLVMNGRVLVVEEHGNRVVDVESGRIEFACPLWVYMQRQKSIMEMEGLVLKYNGPNGEGRCAREFMGQNTLYSANGAVSTANTLIVADTDNHRVIAVKDGAVVTELLNINNPVRVMLVPEKL